MIPSIVVSIVLGQANVSFSSLTHWYFLKRFDADLRSETLEELALEVEDRHRPQASTVEQIAAVWNTSHVLFSITSLYIYIYIHISKSYFSWFV